MLFQLFEKRIGNIQLLQILGDAYERSRRTTDIAEYENILWTALERALGAAIPGARELVIVVDGLDEASCGEQALMKRLTTATANAVNVKLITLGAEQPSSPQNVMHVPVSEERIYDDVSTVVYSCFENSKTFLALPELEQETVVDQITEASRGCFQWAKLCAKRARHEHSPENLKKVVETLAKDKPSVTDFVLHALSDPEVTEDTKYMLLWLATADRPLLLKELTALASIQVDKQTVTDRKLDPLHVLKPVVPLVFLQDGQVYLRHALIRTAVLEVISKGKLIPSVKDRHADFVTRLLVYIKNTVTEQNEPTLTPLDRDETTLLLSKSPLLDFAVHYWPNHLKQTTVFTTGGEPAIVKEFTKLFPVTITLLLLQTTLWQNVATPTLVSFQTIVTNLCRQILTPKSPVTLQSLITLGLLRRDISQVPEAIPLFYEITIISRNLLTIKHLVTMQMATLFLDLTVEQVTTTKSDLMIKREEIFLLVIECYKIHYGNTSEKVVSTLRALIEHYRLTKEEKKIREHEVTIANITGQIGGDDTEAHGDLHVHVQGQNQIGDTGIRFVLDVEEDEVQAETFDFEALLKLAEKYSAERRFAEAERVYVEIWQRANRECRVQYSEHWEQIKLKAVVIYSKFLQWHKRETEASSILSSVWEEYRNTILSITESSASYFHEIANMMTAVDLSAAALSIYKQVAHYYQSTNKTQSSTYIEIQQSISSTSQHIMQQASSSSWVVSESTLEEILYEASSSVTTITQSSFTATHTLVEQYVSQHRWKDATRVAKKVLRGLWPSLFAPSIQDVRLPTQHVEKCLELAERLCQSYHYRHRLPKEESFRVRVYRAVRSGKPVDDKLRERVITELLRFFERSSQPDRVLSTRQEMLDDYTKHYEPEHPIVIKTLRTLADFTHPRPISIEYYERIIRAVNKGSPNCHPDVFEPLITVVTEMWNQSRFSDVVPYYSLLFTTWLNDPKKFPKFQSTNFVQDFFSQYIHSLRSVRADYTVIHEKTSEYQRKVKFVFGATASITVKATLTLAMVCQESKKYEADAIRLYEELLTIKSDDIDRDEITAILDGIYDEQAAAALSSESVSSAHYEFACTILRKRIISARDTYGWAHSESLSKLREMVSFHFKHSEVTSVLHALHESTVRILTTESSSIRLVSAAITIADSYIATNQVSKAVELSQELYRQLVMKDTSNSKTQNFELSSKGRQSLIFLAQLEHSLRQRTSSISEILASLTTEYVYFEEFRSQLSSKTATFHSVTMSASRLYTFLLRSNRQAAATRVFDDFVAFFLAAEGKRTTLTETAQVKILLTTILEHFSTHQSSNFTRSVGIASNYRVLQLLQQKNYDSASDLAIAAFRYISAHDVFRTPAIVKFVFTLGIFITGRTVVPQPDQATQKKLLGVSGVIIQEVLRVISNLKINLAQIGLDYLNILIGLLGEQKDYNNLVWLLSSLWNSRNQQTNWSPVVTLQLARRYILARYLTDDALKASRLAEDIVYNCRRVNGARHASTLEMSTLLSQLYTGVAQRYQSDKSTQNMASKYYKKSAAVHENLLRVFVDPAFADFENGFDSVDGSAYELDLGDGAANGNGASASVSDGEHVRQHLLLLKLAVQRLGDWPKDFAEYKRLNADLVEQFGDELKGVDGVEKWNLKSFGGGKAASNEDVLNLEVKSWELELQPEVEEEL